MNTAAEWGPLGVSAQGWAMGLWRRRGIVAAGLAFLLATVTVQQAQAQSFTVLYNFNSPGGDGANPRGDLIMDTAGNLYGTTSAGGAYGYETVFKLDTSNHETLLHSFTFTDGAYPQAGLVRDAAGNFYGTTMKGGLNGIGTVFKLDTSGNLTVLYNFVGLSDGGCPAAPLVIDTAGNLYGTTTGGRCFPGGGTVFKLDTFGNLTVLHSFTGFPDGGDPEAGLLMDAAGNFYGTTSRGGADGVGTVFKLDTFSNETVLYSFMNSGGDGENPFAGLIMDTAGNLYGTTIDGGYLGAGIVFKLDTLGNETVLHGFTDVPDYGASPAARLVMDGSGNLYGTTVSDVTPSESRGSVFKVDPSGHATLLHSFVAGSTDACGAGPIGGLLMDAAGSFYGTTSGGGLHANAGIVFKLASTNTPTGNDVTVQPTDCPSQTLPVTLTFSTVTQAGNTSVAPLDSDVVLTPPNGYQFGSPATFYNVTSTAVYSGPINICINYNGITFHNPSLLAIGYPNGPTGSWTQLATTIDTAATTVCATTSSLAPFAILEPAYVGQVQSPISADGTSVFNATRGTLPVKFTLSYAGVAVCQLPPAMISLVRAGGSTGGTVPQNLYVTPADTGSYFRIDTNKCQYVYNLATGSLGTGEYVVSISIDGSVVGSGTFGLQ